MISMQMLTLEKYSLGVGDRFAHQPKRNWTRSACRRARAAIVPVWNRVEREHLIVGSEPTSVRGRSRRRCP